MKALSIQQPWSWLIVNGLKDIENREWTTNYRGLLLIHAGKQMDQSFPWERADLPEMPRAQDYELGGIVGYAMLKEVVTESESPWFVGRYGFVLTQRHPVPFIPLRGQLGLFEVPAEIEEQINAIREERAWAADMADMARIKREWYDYRHAGDETEPSPPSRLLC